METPGTAGGQQVSRRIGKDKADSSILNERLERRTNVYTRSKEKSRSPQGHAPSDLLPLARRHLLKNTEPLKIAPPAGAMSQHMSQRDLSRRKGKKPQREKQVKSFLRSSVF